jgi:precorrin-2 dehydrogenase/sirohydrochlorin ferrochelatase
MAVSMTNGETDKAAAGGSQKSGGANLFPMFVKLEGRPVLVVGAGRIAESKIPGLLESGAKVRVVAPAANDALRSWASSGAIAYDPREFEGADLNGVFLVIAATSSSPLNASVFQEARRRNILCNAVDDPENCDFYYGAVVRRGALQLAISTDGKSPALAQRLRAELEEQFGPQYAEWLEQLAEAREELFQHEMDPERRRKILHQLASREAFTAQFDRPEEKRS